MSRGGALSSSMVVYLGGSWMCPLPPWPDPNISWVLANDYWWLAVNTQMVSIDY